MLRSNIDTVGNKNPFAGTGGGGGTWGSITGTLSNQTDLNNALLAKSNITDIIDNLISTDTNKPLSANQGKILNDNSLELINNVYSWKHKVKTKIDNLYAYPADVVLTTTGVADLQTAISALTEGQVLEVQTNATYDPIVIPTTKKIIIRAGIGWLPNISGARCIRVSHNADDVIVSGFIIENATNTGGNNNYTGTCITFNDHEAIVNDVIFHNITMKTTTTGSAVVLSYHWSIDGDNYANPPQLSELSNNVAFVNCNTFRGCLDGTEGACIVLRAMKNAYISDCYIDNYNDAGRGISLQGFLSCLIENNKIFNIGGGNAEAIKLDQIGTSPFVQTAVIDKNFTDTNIEGIDVDDNVSAIVTRNTTINSSGEGITLDDSSRGYFADNVAYDCNSGILFETGSVGYLVNNNMFENRTNYNMQNGYTPDASNISNSTRPVKKYSKALTEGVSTNILTAYVANNTGIGIRISYSVIAINTGTNVVECHYGEVNIIARNQAGTVTNNIAHINEIDLPIGTGITDVFVVTNGTGLITLSLTATSGITPTSLIMDYTIENYGNQQIIKL